MIVLASKSSGRLATLRAAGIEPQVAVSEVDERAVEQQVRSAQPDCGPQVVVQALALAKAQAVAHQAGVRWWAAILCCLLTASWWVSLLVPTTPSSAGVLCVAVVPRCLLVTRLLR